MGEHIGLVGVNGCGKSTLFNIILGDEACDSGTVAFSARTVVGSMKQGVTDSSATLYEYVLEVFSELSNIETELELIAEEIDKGNVDDERMTRLIERQHRLTDKYDALGGMTYRSRTRSALLGLGFTEQELTRSANTFSGGQRNKAQLARLLLSNSNLMLLDEPTNHLDIKAIEWLEGFLSSYRGAFIVISHDRYFLDKVTNRTIELKNQRLYLSEGNYSRHIELRSSARELERRQFLRTSKEIKRIEGIIEQQKRWGQEHNFITAASKQKQVDKLKKTLVAPEKDSSSIHFSFKARIGCGNDVICTKNLGKSFDGKVVFDNVNMLVKRGEKVFILGDNGCGKTTLLNIIAGKLNPSKGSYYLGSHVEKAYYEQTMQALNPNNTVLEEVWERYYATIPRKDMCNALAAFLFRGDDIDKPISNLSGGELARVQLLKLMLTGCNLLLMDEPTNHLDIASREALEAALEDYDGTLVVVTHDRFLVNRLADRILHMDENGLTEYIGGYDEYLESIANNSSEIQKRRTVSDNAIGYKEKKAQQSAVNHARGELNRCEAAIAAKEAELGAIEEKMSLPAVASDYVKAQELAKIAEGLRLQIDELYEKWDAAEKRLASLVSGET